jgi:hypothetical protein
VCRLRARSATRGKSYRADAARPPQAQVTQCYLGALAPGLDSRRSRPDPDVHPSAGGGALWSATRSSTERRRRRTLERNPVHPPSAGGGARSSATPFIHRAPEAAPLWSATPSIHRAPAAARPRAPTRRA